SRRVGAADAGSALIVELPGGRDADRTDREIAGGGRRAARPAADHRGGGGAVLASADARRRGRPYRLRAGDEPALSAGRDGQGAAGGLWAAAHLRQPVEEDARALLRARGNGGGGGAGVRTGRVLSPAAAVRRNHRGFGGPGSDLARLSGTRRRQRRRAAAA